MRYKHTRRLDLPRGKWAIVPLSSKRCLRWGRPEVGTTCSRMQDISTKISGETIPQYTLESSSSTLLSGGSRCHPHLAIFNFAVRIRDHLQKFHDVVMREGPQNADFPDGSDGKSALSKEAPTTSSGEGQDPCIETNRVPLTCRLSSGGAESEHQE